MPRSAGPRWPATWRSWRTRSWRFGCRHTIRNCGSGNGSTPSCTGSIPEWHGRRPDASESSTRANAAEARQVQMQTADGRPHAFCIVVSQSSACDDLELHQLQGKPAGVQLERVEDISVLTLVAVHCRARQPIVAPLVDEVPAPGLRNVVIDARVGRDANTEVRADAIVSCLEIVEGRAPIGWEAAGRDLVSSSGDLSKSVARSTPRCFPD